eukprot:c17506_g1_i1 orf=328-687(-)
MALLSMSQPLSKGALLSPSLGRSLLNCRPRRSPFVSVNSTRRNRLQINAFLNPQDDPIVKEALKEPLAFLGGVFAGVFRLDLNEDPLKEWVVKTSEVAGVQDVEEVEVKEDTPEEIQIE